MSLPESCILRPAIAGDLRSIRKLVFSAKLDPTQLRWEQFWVIEHNQQIIACGQLRNFDGAQELGSLVVESSWRNRGLGTYLTKHSIEQASKPLYLECLGDRLANFYSHLGFVGVSWQELPKSLKFKFGISQLAKTLLRIPVKFMKHSDRANLF
ncbi:MAG: GNAT family N-acetyltransferase [Xenococcaceae cyanobacterium]